MKSELVKPTHLSRKAVVYIRQLNTPSGSDQSGKSSVCSTHCGNAHTNSDGTKLTSMSSMPILASAAHLRRSASGSQGNGRPR